MVLWTALAANATDTIWSGAGTDQWSNPSSWSAGVPGVGDTAMLATEGYLIHLDGNATIGGLELDPNASGSRWLILGQYTLTSSSIVNDSTEGTLLDLATDLIAPVGGLSVLANAAPISLGGGGPDYVETITLNGDLKIGGDSATHIYGLITGSGGLIKDGTGALVVTVSEYMNDFAGDVILNDGLLVLNGFDTDPMQNPTGNVLGQGDIHLHGGTLALTGMLNGGSEILNPIQTIYVGDGDGNRVTIDAAHVESQIDLGDGHFFDQYGAGLETGEGHDLVFQNSFVLGYDTGTEIVAADLVIGNPTDADDLFVEFALADESNPVSSSMTLQGVGVRHSLTAYAEVEIDQQITGAGGLNITSDSTGMVLLVNTENDFAGGVELNGGMLVVNDSNQIGTSALGTGTFAIHGDASDPSQVIVAGAPTEIYYDNGWKNDANNAWDGSIGTVEIGNDVAMQGEFTVAGWSIVEMDDWFDDGNDIPVALIGSNIDISGTTTLSGNTEIVVVSGETEADDGVLDAAVTALNLPANYFTLEISGAIGESGGSYTLAKSGEGTLILRGVNTFTGGFIVDEGVVQLNVANAVAAAPVTVEEDGVVAFVADQTFKALSGSGLVDAQANNLTLGNGQSDFDGTFANLRNVTIAGGDHVIDANMSVQSLAVNAGTLTMDGDLGSDNAIAIANGATAAINGNVEFYFGDAIENSGTLVGDTNSLGNVSITMKNHSTLKADSDGLLASSVSIDAGAGVTLDSGHGLLTLVAPTFNGDVTIIQMGDNTASIRNLDNQAGNAIALDSGTLYLTGAEVWASGGTGGGIAANAGATLIVDAPTQNIGDITGAGTIVKTVNAYASEDDYFQDLGTVDGNNLTLANATIATAQGGTLEIARDVEIETGSTVEIIGESTVVVGANQTLTASDNATLDVGGNAAMQINGVLNVDAGQTLNITGGGTVAINSSNTALSNTATLSVANSTLALGSATATGNAQVTLANSTVQASTANVAIQQANVSGNVQFAGNAVAVQTLDTSAGAATLTIGQNGVQVAALSGTNNVTLAAGRITLTGNSTAFQQTLDVSSDAEVEIDPNAVVGGSVTLAGNGTIDGAVLGAVTVNDVNAVLDGTGAFHGGLAIANGTLEPGHSPGEITVSGGDFVLGSGATLNVEVDQAAHHDSIHITDNSNANFVTGAKVVAVAIGNARDGTYDIVRLDGAGSIQVNGVNQAADANLASFAQNTDLATITAMTVDNTGKLVEMSVDFTTNSNYLGGTASHTVRSFGSMLDSNDFAQSATESLQGTIAQAQASADVAGSYAQMTNQLQASASTAASSVVSSVNTNLGRRMQDARAAARDTLNSPAASPLLASLSPTAGVASAGSGLQGFFQGYGSWGDRDDDGGVVGYDYDTYGSLLGAEQFIREDILLGGSLGYGRTDVDSDDSLSSLNVDSLSLSLYGTWFNNDRYASLTLGYGHHSYDSVRNLEFAGLRAEGDFSAQTFSIAPEVGKLFRVGSFGIEPYAGLNYTHFSQESYTEKGAGDADLSVDDDSDDIVFSELGTRFRKTWAFDDGGYLMPQLTLAWRHDFNDEVVTVAQLAGASTSFRTTAIDVVSDVFDLGAGVEWQIDKNKALCTQYDAELGSGFTAHTLQACVKILF
jgi:outer membrane autotransporter protein